MTNEEIAVTLTEHGQHIKSNTHRIDELEEFQKEMRDLVRSVDKLAQSMQTMTVMMPLMSLFLCFTLPAGLGLYWIYSSLLALVQTIVLNVLYTPDKVKEMVKKDMAKQKKKKKKPSMMEKAIAMQNQQNGTAVTADDDSDDEDAEERKLSKAELKELQRQRLNEARRRMAEKYGDDYSEND